MTAILLQRESKQARWCQRIAIFSAQVVIISLVLHRFDFLGAKAATNLLGLGALGGFFACVLAAAALVRIWGQGLLGGGRAAVGAVIGVLLMAGPMLYLPDLLTRPKINDITTDALQPPDFARIATLRGKDANPVAYPGAEFYEQQAEAYPDIRPMVLERSSEEAFDLAREAVSRLDWQIVNTHKPEGESPGYIEAVARTLVMGYADDVVIRVAAVSNEARIDVRSASRFGDHDFGANAKRSRRLFSEVKAGLEKGERQALEVALAKRAKDARELQKRLREERAKAKREEEARLAKLREEARLEELKRLSELQEATRRIEQGLAPLGFPGVQEQTVRPRARASRRDSHRFWEQFGE